MFGQFSNLSIRCSKLPREVQLKCTFSDFKFSLVSILERTIKDMTVVEYKSLDNFIPNHEQFSSDLKLVYLLNDIAK